jgi:hypothetical protein
MRAVKSDTTLLYNNTGFGISQGDSTANNYGVFTFYTSNWNDAAAFGCRYIQHTNNAAIGQMHIATANTGALVTQLIIDQVGDLTWGSGAADKDYTLTVNGETHDGVLAWMEDEDYFKFSDDIMMLGGENVVLDTSTGTKIGTATTQLLGFYNATPVNQPDAVADVADGLLATTITQLNALLARIRELGLITT